MGEQGKIQTKFKKFSPTEPLPKIKKKTCEGRGLREEGKRGHVRSEVESRRGAHNRFNGDKNRRGIAEWKVG